MKHFLSMYVEAIEAHSWFSNQFHAVLFTLTTAMVKCGVGGRIRVCLGSIIHLYTFLYSDSVTFLSFIFVLQKKKQK